MSFLKSSAIYVTGNGGGSGGRICLYIDEDLRFLGTFSALGGEGASHHGSPGTVWVHTQVGSDVTTHLWVDHFDRTFSCTSYPVYVDVQSVSNFHPLRNACVIPTQVGIYFICWGIIRRLSIV